MYINIDNKETWWEWFSPHFYRSNLAKWNITVLSVMDWAEQEAGRAMPLMSCTAPATVGGAPAFIMQAPPPTHGLRVPVCNGSQGTSDKQVCWICLPLVLDVYLTCEEGGAQWCWAVNTGPTSEHQALLAPFGPCLWLRAVQVILHGPGTAPPAKRSCPAARVLPSIAPPTTMSKFDTVP